MHTTTPSSPCASNLTTPPSAMHAQQTPERPPSCLSKSSNLKQVAKQLAPRNQQKPCVCIPLCGKSASEIQSPTNNYEHEIQTYIRFLPFFQHAYLVHTSTLNRYHYFILWLADLAATGKLQDDAFHTLLPESQLERFLHASSIEEELACLGDEYKHDYHRIYQALMRNELLWNHQFHQRFIDSKTPCSIISWHTVYPETPNNCLPDTLLHTLGLNDHYRSKFQQRMDESIEKYFIPNHKDNTNPKGRLYHQPFPYQPELTKAAETNKRHKQTVLYTLSLKHNRISSLFIHDFIQGNFDFIDQKKRILLMSGHLNMYLRTLFHNAQHLSSANHTPCDLPTYFDPMDKSIPPATEETIMRIQTLHAKQPLNASMKLAQALRQHSPTLSHEAMQDIVAMLMILNHYDASMQHHLTSMIIKHLQRITQQPLIIASPDDPNIAQSYSMHSLPDHDWHQPDRGQTVLHACDIHAPHEAHSSFFNRIFTPSHTPQAQTRSLRSNHAASHTPQTRPIRYAVCALVAGLSFFCAHTLRTAQAQGSTSPPPVRKRFYPPFSTTRN